MIWRLVAALLPLAAAAHVGSPDVFVEGNAGPYRLFVAVRPPEVIPGVATIEVRSADDPAPAVRVTPLPMTGDGAKFPPTPDVCARSADDPRFCAGSLWLMTSGSWQVRVIAEGPKGTGQLAVPVPASAQRTRAMDAPLGITLGALALILAVGIVSIVTASVREAMLAPGEQPDAPQIRKSSRVRWITAGVVAGALFLGSKWWDAEASAYDRHIYKPLEMKLGAEPGGRLTVSLNDPGWISARKLDDLIPDHNHLMHLVIARPALDRIWHLHPDQTAPARFEQQLPDMPPGEYLFWADIVHQNGFPETVTTRFTLPEIKGRALQGDDSTGPGDPAAKPLQFLDEGQTFPVKKMVLLRFRSASDDLEPYMGMPGHAFIIRKDHSVFAHLHPGGSAPMAAVALTRPDDPHAGHFMSVRTPAEFTFPYGFPSAGDYRVLVQVKRNGRVETGAWDVAVR